MRNTWTRLGEFIYEGTTGSTVLQLINHEEGRIIPAGNEYQYHIKDHLGNVRVTFTTKAETEVATAGYEPANAALEQSKFLRYEHSRKVQSSVFDRTNGTATGYAQRLSGGTNEKYGLSRSLSVMPGDKISAEVYAKYVDPVSTNRTPALNSLISQIATLISGGTTSSGTVIDGGSFPGSTASFPFPTQAGTNTTGSSGTGPRAYLNWLVFDRDYNWISSKSGYKRLSATPKETGQGVGLDVNHEALNSPEITIDVAGYVYIFLSNEEATPVDVYFDDFKVTQVKSPVVQMDDYYPFGLAFNSYQRENATPQEFKFNGKEEQTELSLGWLDYGARMYQPELGKFFTQDRFSEKYFALSPYQYAAGNPLKFVDINGDSTYLVIYGAGYTNIRNEGSAHDNGRNFQKNAMALKKQIEGREGFDSERDQVVVVEARSTEQFTDATNKEYETGKIASLTVFSHGTEGSISLGGERGNYDQLDDYDQREINFKTVDKIDKNNFEKTAGVTLYGCNIGSGGETSFAQTMANSLQLTVKAFDGSAEAKSQNRDGKAPLVFDGTMIRTKDRSTQRVQLSIFTPK